MSERIKMKRTIILVLLGMGAFFFIAALLTLYLWVTKENWHQSLLAVALVSLFLAIPVAMYLWTHWLQDRA